MLSGVYNTYLASVSYINLSVLFPIGLGLLIGSLVFLKIIESLLKKFYLQTYYSIIGFVCGSIFVLYEPIHFNYNGLISIFCLLFGFALAKTFDKQ